MKSETGRQQDQSGLLRGETWRDLSDVMGTWRLKIADGCNYLTLPTLPDLVVGAEVKLTPCYDAGRLACGDTEHLQMSVA